MTAPAETKINTKLLNEILDLIEKTPTKWEQASWIGNTTIDANQKELAEKGQYELCGTQACVAGWAMLLSQDWKPVIEHSWGDDELFTITNMARASDGWTPRDVASEENIDEDNVYINEGIRLLGLDYDKAKQIFLYMPYDEEKPKTFTDNVRQFLGLPTKWGATFDSEGATLVYAEGEREE